MRYLDVAGFKAGHVGYKDVRTGVFFNIHGSGSHGHTVHGLTVMHIRASWGSKKPLQIVWHADQLLHGAQQRTHGHLSNILPCTENTVIYLHIL